jgi:hypothetical protein
VQPRSKVTESGCSWDKGLPRDIQHPSPHLALGGTPASVILLLYLTSWKVVTGLRTVGRGNRERQKETVTETTK